MILFGFIMIHFFSRVVSSFLVVIENKTYSLLDETNDIEI